MPAPVDPISSNGVDREPLRIAIVTETYPPEINGVAKTLARMAEGLRQRGHEVLLIRPAQQTDRRSHDRQQPRLRQVLTTGIAIPFYKHLQIGLPNWSRLKRQWREFNPQAAYVATEGPLGMAALRLARQTGVPALTGMHTNFHQYSEHYGLGILSGLVHRHLRRLHNASAGTLVPTNHMADILLKQGFENIRVWPRGVDAELFDSARRDARLRREWGADDDTLVVLYVGRVAPEKNVDLVIRTFEQIQGKRPDARLILVGDGPDMDRLQGQCPGAEFVGPKVGEELARHYASGDLFLFPSQTETFGNVVLEAMASGLAVTAFDLAAAGQLIEDGKNGALAANLTESAFTERSLALIGDMMALRTMGAQARATAQTQSWSSLIRQLEIWFDELATGTDP